MSELTNNHGRNSESRTTIGILSILQKKQNNVNHIN